MSQRPKGEPHIKRMADMLRQGSTLTELACPACSSPLFRLRNGELWCAKCEKKVIVVKEGEEAAKMKGSMALEALEATLFMKIQEIQNKMQQTENAEELQKLGITLSGLLENLDKIKNVRKT